MKRFSYSITLSIVALSSATLFASAAQAGPVRVGDVQQIVSSNPTKQTPGASAQLVVAPQDPPRSGDNSSSTASQDPTPSATPPESTGEIVQQDGSRVITEEEFEVAEDTEPCNCPEIPLTDPVTIAKGGGFPWWLGFGAVPFGFIGCCDGEESTPTPVESVTPPPTVTPSQPPPEVPEPATIFLFGTGLTSIGFAARRWMRRKDENEENEENGDQQ